MCANTDHFNLNFKCNKAFKETVEPVLSVVMPTYNRYDIIGRVLNELDQQIKSYHESIELIICDDASTDSTPEVLEKYFAGAEIPLALARREQNSGPAGARNHALRAARGKIILFLGDDTIPGSGLIQHHIDWHRHHSNATHALLGRVVWPEQYKEDPFMAWLETGGNSFYFKLDNEDLGKPLGGMRFYTCNVSIKKSLLEKAGSFDEDFPYASHEDLELGVRLEQVGMQLYFDPDAWVTHWHLLTFQNTVNRIYKMGYSAPIFWSKTPQAPKPFIKLARRIVARGLAFAPLRATVIAFNRRLCRASTKPKPLRWKLALAATYWNGFYDGMRGVPDPVFVSK